MSPFIALRLARQSFLLAAAYFLAGKFGLSLPYLDSHITLIWLPTGIAMAALLRFGFAVWPGVFLGALFVNLTIPSPTSLAIAIAVGNTLGPLLAAALFKRAKANLALDETIGIFTLTASAALGMLLSSGGGVLSLYALANFPVLAIPNAMATWWAGDFVGVLLAAPLLFNMSKGSLKQLWQQRREFFLWLVSACALGWGVFVVNNDEAGHSLPLVFLMVPIVVWSAMRFEVVGASLATLICMLVAVVATSFGLGPFHQQDAQQGLFAMWAFLAVLVLVQLMVTAMQTQRKTAEDRFRLLAFYDPLTQLPNRNLLMDRLRQALLSSARNQRYGAVMLLDLDHFKNLNDTHGHDAGDLLLVEVARRLHLCARETDTVPRVGGDEFVKVLEHLESDAPQAALRAEVVAEKIRNLLAEPFKISLGVKQSQVLVSHHSNASIGISLFRDSEIKIDELLKRADLTMYQAKAAGRNSIRFFDPAMQKAVENRAQMETHLRHALAHHEFKLAYQLQVNQDGRVIGCEALLRWSHATLGAIPPGEFIPLLEDTGLILPVGDWVIDQACQQLSAWAQEPDSRALSMAVNVSARQFRGANFVANVSAAIRRYGIEPNLLKLELTEGVVLYDIEEAIAKMRQLKALGVIVSLDDFGTGYSSLSYLQRLPINQLKIDQSFVRTLTPSSSGAAIVRAIITLGHTLGLNVIAEGVETHAQYAYLVAHGCRYFQGYYFARPESIEVVAPLIQQKVILPSSD